MPHTPFHRSEEQRLAALRAAGITEEEAVKAAPDLAGQITAEDLAEQPDISDDVVTEPDAAPPTDVDTLDVPEVKPTESEKKQQDIIEQVTDINRQLTGEAEFAAAQRREAGISEQEAALNDLSGRLRDLQREAKAIPHRLQLEAEGRGITKEGLAPIQAAELRKNAIEALGVSALIDASTRRLTSARRKVERAVEEKFGPLKAEKQALLENLQLIQGSPQASIEQKNRAARLEAETQQEMKELERQEQIADSILSTAVNAAKEGVTDAEVLEEIRRLSDNPTEENLLEAQRLATEALKNLPQEPEAQDLTGTSQELRTFAALRPDLRVGTEEFREAFEEFKREKRGGGSGDTEEIDEFSTSRQFIQDNPDASRAELKAGLFERTNLTTGEINTLLDEAGVVEEDVNFTEGQKANIARELVKSQTKLFRGGEVERAKELIENGVLEINGKKVELSRRQIDELIEAIDKEYPSGARSVGERVLPFGR